MAIVSSDTLYVYIYIYIYVGRLISLVNFHEMALQSIWWRDISKDPLFEPLQAKFQPERMHSSRLIVIWSRLSQSLQNTYWRRQWFLHLTRISSHRAKFLSLRTERSHTGPNPKNRVDEESIHSPIRSFVIATIDLWDVVLMEEHFFAHQSRFKWLPIVNYASFLAEIWLEEVWRVNLSRCRVIKWIAPFHGNLPNLSNDPRICIIYIYIYIYTRCPILNNILRFLSKIRWYIRKNISNKKLYGSEKDIRKYYWFDLERRQNQIDFF